MTNMTINQNLVPIVIEKSGRTERAYDIYSRLLKDRIIFLGGPIDDATANLIIAQMLFLSNEDSKNDIHFYVNSPGGSITAGLAVYDTMQFLRCDVATYCVGQAASMAAVLLCAGENGKRASLPNSRIMIHQPFGGGKGHAADIEIMAQEIMKSRDKLVDIIADNCKRTRAQVLKDIDRDNYMSPLEAKKYGLIDTVIKKKKDAK